MDTNKATHDIMKAVELPAIKGPFRGLIIKFPRNTNYTDFLTIYPLITLQHPNYYFSKCDKTKCVIYYKHPYDIATLISKYENNPYFTISIYYDSMTRTLQSNTLYITALKVQNILPKLEQLNGVIVKSTRAGIHVRFEDFKSTAIAHEELRKDCVVKFSYKSCHTHLELETMKLPGKNDYIEDLRTNMKSMLENYHQWTPSVRKKFEDTFKELLTEQEEKIKDKIKRVAENTEMANISWIQTEQMEEPINEDKYQGHMENQKLSRTKKH